jgi:hypothetical protein
MFPEGTGGTASLEYNYMNQNKNWSGTSKAPAANNDDKDIRSNFYTAGMQYMFNRDWGVKATLPYWDRSFTNAGSGTPETFTHSNWGDARIAGIYTGFSPDMSSGLLFGIKLPTGDYTYPNFDRDTSLDTGSTDLLLGAYYMDRLTKNGLWSWFVQSMIDIPMLTRGGFRPGDELDAAVGTYYEGWHVGQGAKIVPVAQILASGRLHDSGSVANPENSGYTRLLSAPGVEFDFGKTALSRNSWKCRIDGHSEERLFLVKLRGCQTTTSSPESFSGPVTACTGRKSTRRTRSWSYGFDVSAATASWSVPAAAARSPMPMTAMNERCGICLGAGSGRRYTSRCIG